VTKPEKKCEFCGFKATKTYRYYDGKDRKIYLCAGDWSRIIIWYLIRKRRKTAGTWNGL